MKITFIGATHEVTGSCYYLEAAGKKFLVDCGMEQGPDYYENQDIPVKGSDLDFVLLTHAHMDHSGNLPAIYAKGFQGPIYATQATCHLCDIMLRDSAHIQMFEAEWRNRKGRRQGKPEFVPAYTMEDAMGVIQNFVPCPYEKTIKPAEGISVRFVDAGHLLGSASIEIIIQEDDKEKKIVFSGDIGNLNQPLIKDPVYLHDADYVVMESTYGDRSHGERPDYVAMLTEVIQHTFDRGGSVVIPSFAVGRTQEMLYFIRQIKEEGRVHGHDNFKVYVDSPLANEATTIFNEHIYDCFDEEAMELVRMHHADGIILCAIENDWKKLKSYGQYGKIVVCNEYNEDCDISMVYSRQYEGFRKASEYLLDKGHRKIAYCTGSHSVILQSQGMNIDSDRYSGYLEGLNGRGVVANPKWLFSGVGNLEDGRRTMHQILQMSERPEAVIAGSDEVAAGMMMEALANGVRVPEDIAIMGVDDQPLASILQIPLTTIRQPIQKEGTYAAKEMVRQLTEDNVEPRRKELDLELVIRQSA